MPLGGGASCCRLSITGSSAVKSLVRDKRMTLSASPWTSVFLSSVGASS